MARGLHTPGKCSCLGSRASFKINYNNIITERKEIGERKTQIFKFLPLWMLLQINRKKPLKKQNKMTRSLKLCPCYSSQLDKVKPFYCLLDTMFKVKVFRQKPVWNYGVRIRMKRNFKNVFSTFLSLLLVCEPSQKENKYLNADFALKATSVRKKEPKGGKREREALPIRASSLTAL